ncbi:ATP-binding cassette domain-containing protein [candidate division WOR-3 bacterium]|nr:ATP-binding cassette domain-containing protein [candidate division WOR-3 bacterium]
MISIKNVCVKYNGRTILDNVSADFEDTRIHLIVGPTGAGKTTFLSVIIGFVKPDEGTVAVPRGDISDLRKRMGILFQFPEEMFFLEKVYEEIALAPISRRMDRIENRVHQALEMVNLSPDILQASPYEISYGEKRRVALASILSYSPDWILLDEPFAGLDRRGINMMMGVIKNLKERGKGVIIASHRIEEIATICDSVTLLVEGRLIFSEKTSMTDWNEIYRAGCDVPVSVRFSMALAENGINIGYPLTIDEAVKRLKEIRREER